MFCVYVTNPGSGLVKMQERDFLQLVCRLAVYGLQMYLARRFAFILLITGSVSEIKVTRPHERQCVMPYMVWFKSDSGHLVKPCHSQLMNFMFLPPNQQRIIPVYMYCKLSQNFFQWRDSAMDKPLVRFARMGCR